MVDAFIFKRSFHFIESFDLFPAGADSVEGVDTAGSITDGVSLVAVVVVGVVDEEEDDCCDKRRN